MNITNKKIIIFVIIGFLILVSAKYFSFAKLERLISQIFRNSPNSISDEDINLNFETSNYSVCRISGTVFIKSKDWNMQKTKDAVFKYRNIDNNARVIFWNISPEDNVRGGPNMFAQLEIPDGEYSPVKFFFKEKPKQGEYIAKAIITYGDWIDGKIKSGKRECEGEIKIIIDEDWQ